VQQGLNQEIIAAFKDNLVYVIGASVGCVFVMVLNFSPGIFENSKSDQVKAPSADQSLNKRANAMINKNLQSDQSLLEFRARKVESENAQVLQKQSNLDFDPSVMSERQYEVIDPSVRDGSDDIYEEIFGDEAIYDNHLNPSERIEAKLLKMKMLEEYDYQQKLAYIEAFIKNAYEEGYQVEINDELEVVRIKKITTDEPYRGTATLDKLLGRKDL
jgi:hypothetical protein